MLFNIAFGRQQVGGWSEEEESENKEYETHGGSLYVKMLRWAR